MVRAGFFRAVAIFALLLVLGGCAGMAERDGYEGTRGQDPFGTTAPIDTTGTAPAGQVIAAGSLREPVRVALLVPQSGPSASVGEALMQAAQLAVFDVNEPQFQLIPKDTQGTAAGTQASIAEAAREGAQLVLGPLFAQEVEAAKSTARVYGLTVIGFSTDWRVAGDNALIMGVLPFGQVERIGDYAARQGLKRVAVIAANDMYGQAVSEQFGQTAARNGITIVKTVRIAPDGRDATSAAQEIAALEVDAVFAPVGGQAIKIIASTLKSYGHNSNSLKLLGTGLWDDPSILSDANMAGAVYAAPSPAIRGAFERNYQRVYGTVPPRIASIGYDAAALSIALAREASTSGRRVTYDRATLLNPNGFSGIDGIFRFRPDGLAERGLAVLEISGGQARVLENAPTSFVK